MPEGLAKIMPYILGGTAVSGEVGNILADKQRADLLSQEKKAMALTPQQLGAKVTAATKPLDTGLVEAITNIVQGTDAGRGLSGAPGILSADLGQALAPAYQQNQNTALQLILKQLGLPVEAAGLLPGMTNLAPVLALLMKSIPSKTAPAPTGGTGGFTLPTDWNVDLGLPPTVGTGDTGSIGAQM